MDDDNIVELATNEEIINKYLKQDDDNNKIDVIHNDDINYINSNNKSFSNLLNTYVKNANRNLIAKLIFKSIFFLACVGILIGIAILLIKITWFCLNNEVSTDTLIVTMVNTLISFLSSFIVLPKIIAEYLYNSDEEKDMTELIKNIQERDKTIRANMKD